jgi:hypothetical protein
MQHNAIVLWRPPLNGLCKLPSPMERGLRTNRMPDYRNYLAIAMHDLQQAGWWWLDGWMGGWRGCVDYQGVVK